MTIQEVKKKKYPKKISSIFKKDQNKGFTKKYLTIFLQREAVPKPDILLRKVKLCFLKKLNKKEQ